jgi:hypothetical protein
MRSASTRASASARAFMSCCAVEKLSCSMRGDLLVGQAVGRLDVDACLDAAALLPRLTLSRPSASTVNVTRMRAAPGGHRRDAAQLEARQAAAVCTRSRSPCTTWMAIAVWPSL